MSYPVQVRQWLHEKDEKFLGQNTPEFLYGFNLSRPTFESGLLFHVAIKNTYTNSFNGVVFLSDTVSTFKIKETQDPVCAADLFPLVDTAAFAYAQLFHERTRQTTLLHHKIAKPQVSEVLPTLQATVDIWEEPVKEFKAAGRMNLNQFRDLPPIPEAKQFKENIHHTEEQLISHKLHMGQQVSSEELKTFEGLSEFYNELDNKLTLLDYGSFRVQEVKDFENYILYAFRSLTLLSDDVNITRLYRLVVNEEVTGRNEPITHSGFLSYPPLKIVKDKNVYNRANTAETTVFYAAQTVDAALKEIRPEVGKLVSIGVWRPEVQRDFIGYPIVHDEATIEANPEVKEANKNVREMEQSYHPALLKFFHYYIKLLSREYAKPVSHKLEYMLSALFSEHIFKIADPNPAFNYDCILYPSVGNGFKTFNFAVKPAVIDRDFQLEKVIQFEITETGYNQAAVQGQHPEYISLARFKDYRVTQQISKKGEISW
ncbi:hypothetical protein [Mucilaginibacter sp. UYCu711]|uniref:hypothetical protein n=1 Tax=Mucilaginibacter sp. UYCu711 TaxID=3156339 RepID=UPI003D1E69C0